MIKIINRDGAEVQLGDIVEDKEGKQYSVEDIEGKTLTVLAEGAKRKATKKSSSYEPRSYNRRRNRNARG
jgi:hypothetical protein